MKNIKAILLSFAAVAFLAACSDDDPAYVPGEIGGITFSLTNVEGDDIRLTNSGSTYQLQWTVNPTNATVEFVSSDPGIFSVDEDGLITAFNSGQEQLIVNIRLSDGRGLRETYDVSINVLADDLVGTFTADHLNVFTLGETANISGYFELSPSGVSETRLNYTSSDPTVATVDPNGNVAAFSAGTTTITASTMDGSELTAATTIDIQVIEAAPMDREDWVLTASGQSHATNYPISKIVDGNTAAGSGSEWRSNLSTGTKQFMVDLGQSLNYPLFAEYYRGTYTTAVTAWVSTSIVDGIGLNDASFVQVATSVQYGNLLEIDLSDYDQPVRYIKFVHQSGSSSTYASCAELYLYGAESE